MTVNGMKLDDAAVAAAKKRFERKSERGFRDRMINSSFDGLLQLFASDCNSFASIGSALRVSRERVRQVYNLYFRSLFPAQKSGRKRKRICFLKQQRVAACALPEDEVLRIVAKAAKHMGCEVKQTLSKAGGLAFKSRELLINRRRCLVHCSSVGTRPGKTNKRLYGKTKIARWRLASVEFCAILRDIEGFSQTIFFVPVGVLLAAYDPEKAVFWLRIPTERIPVYHNVKSRIDWWKYENAFDLIKEKSE